MGEWGGANFPVSEQSYSSQLAYIKRSQLLDTWEKVQTLFESGHHGMATVHAHTSAQAQ